MEGKSGVRRFSAFDAADYPCKIAGEVIGFDPAPYFRDAKSIKRADRFMQFAMAASKMALEESNLGLDQVNRDRFGVSIGTGIGGLESMERGARRLIEQGPSRISPFAITGMMGMPAVPLFRWSLICEVLISVLLPRAPRPAIRSARLGERSNGVTQMSSWREV